jgi:hypothetical protein
MNTAFFKPGTWRSFWLVCRLTPFIMSFVPKAFSQTSVQVVTKVVEREFAYVEGEPIRLNAQKADITIKGWNRPAVSVRLRLVAKHPDKAIAEREVAYHQYLMQASGNELELSNRFVIPQRAGKLQSQLKVIYDVNLPARALLQLTNSFGDLRLSDLSGDVTIKFEFGRLSLDDMEGKLTITSDYGDIDGRNLNAVLVCKAEKADISLRELGGSSRILSRYGKLTIVPNATTLDALHIEAARTEILFAPRRLTDFRYDVITTFADIRVPESVVGELGRYGSKQTFTYQPPGARKPEIQIQTSYSPVVIQGEKSFSRN